MGRGPIPTPGPTRFGWCLDGHHEGCPGTFVDWNSHLNTCSCDCHKEN